MNSGRKIPLRKCVATGEMKPKKDMVRVVRSSEGEVSVDPTGRKNGRGAYITLDKESILLAKKKNILSNQLKTKVEDTVYDELIQLAESRQS
ncbi:YlxR family protein [Bacillus sp. FJAT-42376]|uniref:RNase P modulator RnpM n=1 Tax=Bacillus sp. FJAT-42376 TaxID=2014076 RepID=UPI000F4F45B9|nr:YlxR family protein [Bacillus sp. FJAT-42376]AZB42977.1 YlxR family protein [Bacillus sp. FJAT-42376]